MRRLVFSLIERALTGRALAGLALISFALLAVPAISLPVFAQAKHSFTFEDMMKLKRVGDPQVSPDGKWVIFSVVDVSLEANTKTPHIWIVPLEHVETAATAAQPSIAERILIADQDGDRPRWSPDGKRFAFMSNKEGGSQVWIADFDGAAGSVSGVYRLTSIATEAGGELWSPDGKNILFTSDVYPECDGAPDSIACNAKKLDEAGKSKVKAQIFDHLLYRHWNAYKEGKRSHIFVVGVDECADRSRASLDRTAEGGCPHMSYRDLTPGDYDAPVFSLSGQDDYAFSPDGKEICYASNHDKNPAASTNNDLWIVPVNAGTGGDRVGTAASAVQSGEAGQSANDYVAAVLAQTKNITAANPASDSTPLYSPDGRYIAYRAQQRPGYESDRFDLMLYDRNAGTRTQPQVGPDRSVGTLAWSPDSLKIFYVETDDEAQQRGQKMIWSIGIAGPGIEVKNSQTGKSMGTIYANERVTRGYDDDLAPSSDGKTLLFTRMSIVSPIEIHKVSLPKKIDPYDLPKDEQLTHFNDAALSQVAMSPLESFWFSGAHNDKVQGFLVKPPNFDANKKYPVKFLIHGGPQGAWGDDWSYRWNPELFAANGYVVIMINFHGSTGYGQKFIDAINGDWGGAPFEDLMKGLDYAEEHYPFIDKTRECALGASYGGYMINWILGHTDRFKCLVSHDGMFNAESAWGTTEELWFNDWEFKGTPYDNRASYEKWSPHQYAKNFKTPTLVIHGQRDYRLDVSEGLQLFTTLQMEGVPSEMLYFPDEGHWVQKPQNSELWYKTVNDWVDRWTKP
jgi:dipeptidyl aminopeptidase/acylaminoacyl peptidase